jgi:anaerobic magnesium-protoporphyrin IX monomethyl ester cyclase
MKVLLVNPSGMWKNFPSIGLGYLGAILLKEGYDVKICDSNYTGGNPLKTIDSFNPDVVGASTFSATVNESSKVAQYAKALSKTTLMGGPHIAFFQNDIAQNNFIDYSVWGEGEKTLPALLKSLENNNVEDIRQLPGMVFKENGNIIINPPELIRNLDDLPFPDYKLAGLDVLRDYPLFTSRGCPYNCVFCSIRQVMGSAWRGRSPKNVVDELIAAKESYSAVNFHVLDDNFTFDVGRAKKICELLLSENIKMEWDCPNGIRADRLDDELVSLMAESGCKRIAFGIESGSPEVFKDIGKGETLEKIEEGIKLTNKYKINVQGFFIIGLPGATFERELESINFAKRSGLDSASFGMAIPYPGTRLMEWVKNNANILKDFKDYYIKGLETQPYFETKEFPKEEMIKAFTLGNLQFGSYFLGLSENKLMAGIGLIKIILKYDAKNLPFYLYDIAKKKLVLRTIHKIKTRLGYSDMGILK